MTSHATYEGFIEYIRDNGAYSGASDAYRAAEQVLEALGECLEVRVARQVAIELPTPFGLMLGGAHRDHDSLPSLDDLCERLADRTGMRLCFAVVQAGVVLEAIALTVRPKTLEVLRAALPEPLARMCEAPMVSAFTRPQLPRRPLTPAGFRTPRMRPPPLPTEWH